MITTGQIPDKNGSIPSELPTLSVTSEENGCSVNMVYVVHLYRQSTGTT